MTTEPNKNHSSLPQAISKNALILGVFALVSTGLIAITYQLTKDKIAQEVELALIRQLSEIVPSDDYDNDVYQDCILITDRNLLGSEEAQKLYRMRKSNSNYAAMMTFVAPDGYSGKIMLALAAKPSGELLGVNIVNHNETPGLGDKIEREKSDWIKQFDGLSLSSVDKKYWNVTKDGGKFDALTGATITPRAVVKSVYKALEYLQQNNHHVFNSNSNCYKEENI